MTVPASLIVLSYHGNTKYFEDIRSQRLLSLLWLGKGRLATNNRISGSQNNLQLM